MYPRTGSSERSPRRWVSPPRRTRTSHLNQGDPGDLSAWAIASFLSPLIHRSAWKGYSQKLDFCFTGFSRKFATRKQFQATAKIVTLGDTLVLRLLDTLG